ncbi:Ger(x)C family spore germination protein [Pontibacillus litoralis]|uniref:Spore germination protein n=1 Tax=Pontibacillus litoralis JSM 072002 TaxID=1385512 RepID=A0A0A5HUT7_9BACI|nr:Ger(x)C family spore germination protein [Pontibacillus litoralis]KGX87397.1 hypothetical protein N784_15690 [Pontibacillus litoralis JSM 072002]
MRNMFIVLLCIVTIISGCVQKNYIEYLGIVTAIGFDLLENERIEGTHIIHQFDPNATNISQNISSQGNTTKGILYKANLKTSKDLSFGQLHVILYGQEVAEKGLMRLLDTIERDSDISDMLYLAVSDTTSKEVLAIENYEDAPNIGVYLHKLIKKNIEDEIIPDTTLHEFLYNYYDYGSDPILPVISTVNGKATIQQLAIMQNDQMVGAISTDDAFFIKLIRDQYKAGQLDLSIPQEVMNQKTESPTIYINLDEIRSRSNIQLTDMHNLHFEVNINLKARLLEISENIPLDKEENVKQIEQYMNKYIPMQLEELLQKLQQLQSDPFGFGLIYQKHTGAEALKEDKWREIFPDISVQFNVETQLLRSGIIR